MITLSINKSIRLTGITIILLVMATVSWGNPEEYFAMRHELEERFTEPVHDLVSQYQNTNQIEGFEIIMGWLEGLPEPARNDFMLELSSVAKNKPSLNSAHLQIYHNQFMAEYESSQIEKAQREHRQYVFKGTVIAFSMLLAWAGIMLAFFRMQFGKTDPEETFTQRVVFQTVEG